MTKKTSFISTAMFIMLAQSAMADVHVDFTESAPKDRFVISNTGSCDLKGITLSLDLSKSAGRLIFDTTSSGPGVEVYQPFQVTKGEISIASPNGLKDGDSKLSILIPMLAAAESVSFTIDVDDTLPKSALGNIRVAGSEIANGLVKISSPTLTPTTATFSRSSKAVLSLPACTQA